MFIYNVTSKVEWSIHDEWVKWMLEEHMPEVVATGCFDKFQLVRILETDEDEGPTYAAQYHSPSKSMYNEYISRYAPALREKANLKFGGKFVSFRSVMQIVN